MSTRNVPVEECHVDIGESLTLSEREWLVTSLEREPGIRSAHFVRPDLHLRLLYEPAAFSRTTLLDAVQRHHRKARLLTAIGPGLERVLVAVDPKGTSRATVDYVGRMVGGRRDVQLCLYCRFPELPPELREHGGAEDPERERELDAGLARRVDEWRERTRREIDEALEAARATLVAAGVAPEAIEIETTEAAPGETLAASLARVARADGCHTIALARTHVPLLEDLLHRHAGDSLVHAGRGFAVWVVE